MNSFIDQLLSSNTRLQAVAIAMVAIHGLAGFWAWRRGDLIPALALSAAFAATILVYHAPRLSMSIASQDNVVLALLAFEALALAGCIASLCGWTMPRAFVWLVFAVHALMSVAMVVFAVTFRITRLF